MFSFARLIAPTLNHLIQGEPWARERLRQHGGAQALIRAGLVELHLVVDEQGFFRSGTPDLPVAVTVNLPADTPLRLLSDRKSIFQVAKLSGSADFAETLAFVFRNLRWDIEAELAHLVGDIPARRLEMLRLKLVGQARESVQRVSRNLSEYASEDADWLAPRRDVAAFGKAVDELRDDVARLEKRLDRL